jgi:hypothetical protein
MQSRLASYLRSSYFSFPSARITEVKHHAQLDLHLKESFWLLSWNRLKGVRMEEEKERYISGQGW